MEFFNRLVIVIIFGDIINEYSTIQFIVRPRNMTVNSGDVVTLECTADQDPQYYIWEYSPTNPNNEGSSQILGFCFRPKACQIKYWHSQIQISNRSHLTILNISSNNTGRYTCETSNPNQTEPIKSSAMIIVKTPPKSISIQFNRSKNVFQENEYIAIQCSANGGIPSPKIFMSVVKGKQINPLNVTLESQQQIPTAEISATSLWRPHYLQHQGFIMCTASNDAGSMTSNSSLLNIKFEPKIRHFLPSTIMATVGEKMELNCDVTANPKATVQWIIQNGAQRIDSSDLIAEVKPDLEGQLTCQAKNNIGSRSESLLLIVLRDPQINIKQIYTIPENSDDTITCHVDSVPAPDFIKWYKLSNSSDPPTVLISNDARLNFQKTDRSSSGMYVCVTQNTQILTNGKKRIANSEKTMHLIVTYKPGEPRINNGDTISVLKGDPFALKCSVNEKSPGEPFPSLKWIDIQSKNFVSHSHIFEVRKSESRHNGQFQCQAKNEVGSTLSSNSVVITINESPSLISRDLNTKIYLNYSDLPHTVSFNCTFRGKPLNYPKWRFGNEVISSLSQIYKVEVRESLSSDRATIIFTKLIIKLSHISHQDSAQSSPNGQYVCEISNKHGNVSLDYFLIIKYPPMIQVDIRRKKIAASLSQSIISIQCQVESISLVHITWYRTNDHHSQPVHGKKYSIQTVEISKYDSEIDLFKPGAMRSQLNITNIERDDITNYTCVAQNEQGITKVTFEVVFESAPDSPYDLKVTNLEWDSVTISWKSGFNGGHQQNFEIQVNSDIFGLQNVPLYADKEENTLTITGLHPSTQYEIKIYAINNRGRSSSSETVKCVTKRIHKFDKIRAEILPDQPKIAVIVPEPDLCANLEYTRDNGRQWFSILHCVRFNASHINETVLLDITRVTSILDLQSGLIHLRLTFCLLSRPGVCSVPSVLENPKGDNFATQTIILVIAVICFLLIIILITLFIVCCIRFRYHCVLCNQEYCCDCCFPRFYSTATKGIRHYNNRKNYENKPLSCSRISCEDNLDEVDITTGSTSNYCSSLIGSSTPHILNKKYPPIPPNDVYSSFICPHHEFRPPILYGGSSFLQPAVLPWPQKISPPSCEASSSHSHSSTGSSGRNLPQNPIHYRKKQDGISNNSIFNLKSYAQMEEKIKLPDVTSEAIHFVKASNDEKVMEAVV